MAKSGICVLTPVYLTGKDRCNDEEKKEHCTKLFPNLKRWKYTCTDECASGYNLIIKKV